MKDAKNMLAHEITALDATIAQQEQALNAITYRLYNLTPEEIATIESGTQKG